MRSHEGFGARRRRLRSLGTGAALILAAGLLGPRPAQAAPDPADYLFRLGMLEGHLIVGHDLLKAGQPSLALPHFGHPVRELYDDITDYIAYKHIKPFDTQLIRLEAAVAGAPNSPQTEALYQATIATVHQARMATPEALRNSIPEMIRICADTIDAAAGEYGEALNRGRIDVIVEYHDSRGFLSYVSEEINSLSKGHLSPADQTVLQRFRAVLAKAWWIVDPIIPSATPRASVGQYRAIASEAAGVTQTASAVR